jgi:hypothetical protein
MELECGGYQGRLVIDKFCDLEFPAPTAIGRYASIAVHWDLRSQYCRMRAAVLRLNHLQSTHYPSAAEVLINGFLDADEG